MELYVFERDLNFKGILEEYSSLRWIRKYSKHGEFELQCPLTRDTIDLLNKECIIWKRNDEEAGYIEYRNMKQDKDGKEILIIKGRFLTGYLNRRVILGTEIFDTTIENAMRCLIDKNCINPDDVNRVIQNLCLGEIKNLSSQVNYQVSYKNLLEEIERLALSNDIGIKTKFDIKRKKLIFNIYVGKDLTVDQSKNIICIFSKEFENVLEQEYTDSLNNYRNVNIIGGAGQGTGRSYVTIGQYSGLDRFELFTDARDLQDISNTEYEKILAQRGLEKLSEYKEIKTFDSKININSNLTYKKDFDLGDIVTCTSKKWGVTVNTRITEIEEVYDQQGLSINVVFGNNIPTLIDKIKQKIRM